MDTAVFRRKLQKNRDFERIRKNMTELLLNDSQCTDDSLKALEFMSDAFSAKSNKKTYYRITSAFYNSLLFYEESMNQKYDGLIYPSANTEGEGLNVVLKKELIDTGVLNCDMATMYSIIRLLDNSKILKIMPASNDAHVEDGKLLRVTKIY